MIGFQEILKKILARLCFYRVSFSNNAHWKYIGRHSKVIKPMKLVGKKFISIGSCSYIMNDARIEAVYTYAGEKFSPSIKIGNNVDIQQRVHITCAESVEISDGVSILPDVLITDINHPYVNISIPPKEQLLEHNPVFIGPDTIVGMGARILPGVKIGKHCCIGANAVVTKDVPDYSVAVGIPAKVIKKYDFEKSEWVKITKLLYSGGGSNFYNRLVLGAAV